MKDNKTDVKESIERPTYSFAMVANEYLFTQVWKFYKMPDVIFGDLDQNKNYTMKEMKHLYKSIRRYGDRD